MDIARITTSCLFCLAIGCGTDAPADTAPVDTGLPTVGPPTAMMPTPTPGAAPGTAGTQAPAPAAADPAAQPATPPTPADMPGMDDPAAADPAAPPMYEMAMDECGLNTGFIGDEYCILPPPPDKGFQLHIGPSNYDNPESEYVLGPGQEVTNDLRSVSGNSEETYFYYRQYRMRPGAHHMIASQGSGGLGGRRIATSNTNALDSPPGGIVAPENAGVGVQLGANTTISVSLHSINTTDQPVLREIWINFWYVDPDTVTQPASQLFHLGDPTFAIQPGEETTLGPYTCDIPSDGRMLWFYGHRHANNLRFTAWRVRGSQRDLFYEGYDWEDVLVLEYSSLIDNPLPDRERHIEGGWTGPLDFQAGDKIEWECHVRNMTDGVVRFANETYTGEMCILDGEMVGTNCSGGGGFGF